MIPKGLRPFFWEVDGDAFDPRQYGDYAIGRILELGTEPAISWMKTTFTEDEIKQVIRGDRKLSPKSATFWALVYGIPTDEVAALASCPTSL